MCPFLQAVLLYKSHHVVAISAKLCLHSKGLLHGP